MVITAALAVSWWSLYALGHEIYGMPQPLAAGMGLIFDAAAIIVGDICHRYATSPYSSATPRLVMLGLIGCSVWLNTTHARIAVPTGGVEVQIAFAAPAVIAIIMFELQTGWDRRNARDLRGRMPPALPVLGQWAWIFHPLRSLSAIRAHAEVTLARVRTDIDTQLDGVDRTRREGGLPTAPVPRTGGGRSLGLGLGALAVVVLLLPALPLIPGVPRDTLTGLTPYLLTGGVLLALGALTVLRPQPAVSHSGAATATRLDSSALVPDHPVAAFAPTRITVPPAITADSTPTTPAPESTEPDHHPTTDSDRGRDTSTTVDEPTDQIPTITESPQVNPWSGWSESTADHPDHPHSAEPQPPAPRVSSEAPAASPRPEPDQNPTTVGALAQAPATHSGDTTGGDDTGEERPEGRYGPKIASRGKPRADITGSLAPIATLLAREDDFLSREDVKELTEITSSATAGVVLTELRQLYSDQHRINVDAVPKPRARRAEREITIRRGLHALTGQPHLRSVP